MATEYKTTVEERKHPIIEDCEVNDKGNVKHEFMLSLNGMYISGITHEQLKELRKEVDNALDIHEEEPESKTHEGEPKAKKYYYVLLSFMRSDAKDIRTIADITVDVKNYGDFFPLTACIKACCEYFSKEAIVSTIHIDSVVEISERDFYEFRKFRAKQGSSIDIVKS